MLYNQGNCSIDCPFHEHCYNRSRYFSAPYTIGSEYNRTKTLLLFESPGANEINFGTPLADVRNNYNMPKTEASYILQAFDDCSLNRRMFDIAYAIRCYTGTENGNNNDYELKEAARNCEVYLEGELTQFKYPKIVCFSERAYLSVINILARISATNSYYPMVIHIESPMSIRNRILYKGGSEYDVQRELDNLIKINRI